VNKIEIIATFSALEKLCELKSYDKLQEVIQEVLQEARSGSKRGKKEEQESD